MTDPIRPEPPKRLFTLGVNVATFASWARILVRGYTWPQFSASPGFDLIRWSSGQRGEDTVAALAKDPKRLYELSKWMLQLSRATKSVGESHYQSDPQTGHRYAAFTALYKFAAAFAPWLADGSNNNVFRLMLSGFPPYGRQVPGSGFRRLELVSPDAITTLDDLGDLSALLAGSRRQQLDDYNAKLWAANEPLAGPAYLGRSGTIHLSDAGTISNTEDKLVVRYAVASTDKYWHVFDGRVLWVHVVDLNTNEMMYYGIGGGSNSQSFYNGVNGVTGAFVFGGMLSMMNFTLKAAGSPEALKHYPTPVLRQAALQLMEKEDLSQVRAQYAANALDVFGTAAAMWRLFGFRQVTGGPPAPGIDETP